MRDLLQHYPVVEVGETFYFAASHQNHLFFVISDPSINAQEVVLVNMTTYEDYKDNTCLLRPGDHEEVKHLNCITSASLG